MTPLPTSLLTARQRRIRKGFKYIALLMVLVLVPVAILWRNGLSLAAIVKLDPEVVKFFATLTGGAKLTVFVGIFVLLFKGLSAILPVAKSVGEFCKES